MSGSRLGVGLIAIARILLSVSDEFPPAAPWSQIWWHRQQGFQSDGVTPLQPTKKRQYQDFDDDGSGVHLRINHPKNGLVNRYVPTLGDMIPQLQLTFGEGWLSDQVRSNASAFGICMSVDGQFVGCENLVSGSSSLPRLHLDSRRGMHILRVWLGAKDAGSTHGQIPQQSCRASATSRFMTQIGALGTGCRSVANWFLAAVPPKGPLMSSSSSMPRSPRGLMGAWYLALAQRWRELLDLQHDSRIMRREEGDSMNQMARHASARMDAKPPLWRYFEMDCVMTELRRGDERVDRAVQGLANFPVGNLGQIGTPHEFLMSEKVPLPSPKKLLLRTRQEEDWVGSTKAQIELGKQHRLARNQLGGGAWMLKLKASDPIDAAEYHTFIAEMRLEYEKQAKAFNFHDSESMHRPALNIPGTREATGSIPRVIWMFWAQGEAHTSISRRDELCIEGWRQLNTPDGWEVRVLDDVTARHWALPVLELFESGLPHGALFYQVRVHSEDAAALYPFAFHSFFLYMLNGNGNHLRYLLDHEPAPSRSPQDLLACGIWRRLGRHFRSATLAP